MTTETSKPLDRKTALVTGGGRGIGAAIARKLAAIGAAVTICGRRQPELDRTCAAIRSAGGTCEGIVCDLTDIVSVEHMSKAVLARRDKLDILVNNAGIGGFGGPLHTLSPEHWDAVLNTNLRGIYYTIRAFAPAMIAAGTGGDIINISSLAGKNPLPNGAAYAASKWGLNGLSYSVAEELRAYKIRVTVVCPGSVDTSLSPHTGKDAGKMLRPDDVAHIVAMIVTQSPQSFASEILLRPTQKP